MLPTTLYERIQEIIRERPADVAFLSGIKKETQSCSLQKLEEIAAALDALPLVFHRTSDGQLEDIGEELFMYGEIPLKQYIIPALSKNLSVVGLSQSQLATQIKVSPSTISMFLSGRRVPRLNTLEKMAAAVNLVPSYLVPKAVGKPPLRTRKESFETVIQTLEEYLTESPKEHSLSDLYQAIEYGTRIKELTAALKVRHSVLRQRT